MTMIFALIIVCVFVFLAVANKKRNNSPKSERFFSRIVEHEYFCTKDNGEYIGVWPKNQNFCECMEFEIAGITYRESIDNYLGEFVGTLNPEPTNPYDANAIKILAPDGHHVGYVPKDLTNDVRRHRTLPCKCYVYIGKNSDSIYFSCCYIKI